MAVDEIYRNIGGYDRRRVRVKMRECPRCRWRKRECLVLVREGQATCYNCKGVFPIDTYRTVSPFRWAVSCRKCHTVIEIMSDNVSGVKYVCPYPCENIVGLKYGKACIQPEEVLSRKWNEEACARGHNWTDSISVVEVTNKKDILVVKLFHSFAESDGTGSSFLCFREEEQKALIIINRGIPCGNLIWSELGEKVILNQLFFLKGQRRKGFGSVLLKYFVETQVSNRYSKFFVESPVANMIFLLDKCGYVDGSAGVQCFHG